MGCECHIVGSSNSASVSGAPPKGGAAGDDRCWQSPGPVRVSRSGSNTTQFCSPPWEKWRRDLRTCGWGGPNSLGPHSLHKGPEQEVGLLAHTAQSLVEKGCWNSPRTYEQAPLSVATPVPQLLCFACGELILFACLSPMRVKVRI